MKSLAPNTLLQNRYLVVQLIGKGGMGEVYLAVDQRLGSAVAIKRTLFSDEEALGNAFEREAKMLARLRHPALTKVSDHFTENNLQHLVMEHITGDDLSKRLEDNQKPFPVSWVLFWADQLLDALTYLHSHEPPIIHRDIKPQNLKLTNENNIILLDFGLAKNTVGETRLSTTGNVVAYTPHYASMEQIRGTGTTARSDIYSLSATMYQLLTNTVPADALSRADSLLNNLPDPVKPLNQINQEVPVSIANIIAKGMNVSAEQRFATAKEMQNALREAYSQSQSTMAADTVAFNVGDVSTPEAKTPEIKQSDVKTEVFSMPDLGQPIGEKTELMPTDIGTNSVGNVATNDNFANNSPNFEATVPFVSPIISNEPEKSSFVDNSARSFDEPLSNKDTSADFSSGFGGNVDFGADDAGAGFGENTIVSPIEYSFLSDEKSPDNSKNVKETKEGSSPNIDFSDQNDVSDNNESYNPDVTVPIVNLGQHIPQVTIQDSDTFIPVSHDRAEINNFEKEEETAIPAKETVNKTEKKGGGSKVFIIIGILAILGFLGLGAVGAGLYVFKPELFNLADPTPEPTPTVELTPTPTVEPTTEPTVTGFESDSNTDVNSSNVNSSTETDDNNTNESNTNSNEDGTIRTPTPISTRTPTPVPTRTTVPTATRTPPPPTRTPTPTPTKDPAANRKRIEQ